MATQSNKKRIHTQLVDLTTESLSPMESVVGSATAHLDDKFARVFRPIQKEYIQTQTELYEEEHVLLQAIIADMRDLLHHIYEYRMRGEPDRNMDLFCELNYRNFKLRHEADFLMKMIHHDSELFYLDNYPAIIAPENEAAEDTDDIEEVVHI